MPDSYVTSARITGNQLTFRVQVDDFQPSQVIEISGQATQIGGAFAPISAVRTVPAQPNADKGDEGKYYVDVTASKMGEYPFRRNQEVTVFVRVSRVWVTVLGPQDQTTTGVAGNEVGDGMKWDQIRKVSQIDDGSSSAQGGYGQQPATGPPSDS
jgi:hypothetical protein